MGDHTTRQAIKYYKKAKKGSEEAYDKFIDYIYSLKKPEVIPIMEWLIKNASRGCLLDMLVSSLNYEDGLYETLRRQAGKRFGTVYHWPNFNPSTKLPSE